jgi:hypothetical protein
METKIEYAEIEKKDFVESPLLHHKLGLQYTASGYGSKIPTRFTVKHNNRIKRVYCSIYSNIGSLYIMDNGKRLYIRH